MLPSLHFCSVLPLTFLCALTFEDPQSGQAAAQHSSTTELMLRIKDLELQAEAAKREAAAAAEAAKREAAAAVEAAERKAAAAAEAAKREAEEAAEAAEAAKRKAAEAAEAAKRKAAEAAEAAKRKAEEAAEAAKRKAEEAAEAAKREAEEAAEAAKREAAAAVEAAKREAAAAVEAAKREAAAAVEVAERKTEEAEAVKREAERRVDLERQSREKLEHEMQELISQVAARDAAASEMMLKAQFVNGEGLPEIIRLIGSSSAGPSSQAQGPGRELPTISQLICEEKLFGVFSADKLPKPSEASRWRGAGVHLDREWNCESDIKRFVRSVLSDAIRASGIALKLCEEIQVVALRPDLYVVSHNLYPLGVVEVKIPKDKFLASMPDKDGEEETVLHQLTCYMLMLQNYFALPTVFGIITTYQEWRICWLASREADRIAAAASPQDLEPASAASRQVPFAAAALASAAAPAAMASASFKSQEDEAAAADACMAAERDGPNTRSRTRAAAADDDQLTATRPEAETAFTRITAESSKSLFKLFETDLTQLNSCIPRQARLQGAKPEQEDEAPTLESAPQLKQVEELIVRIGVSQIFEYRDPQTPAALVTFMLKLASLSLTELSVSSLIPLESRRFVCFSDSVIVWRPIDKHHLRNEDVEVMKPPSKKAALMLLGCLGQGADGQAWLVRDSRGHLSMLKLTRNHEPVDKAMEVEFERWKMAHAELVEAELVQLRHFGKGSIEGLVMPRFAHVTERDRSNPDVVHAVRAEIKNFAQKNLVHNDLHWRHVGLYRDRENVLRAVFFDLARLKQDVPTDDAWKVMTGALFEGQA
jgi:hypothetical protein